MTSAEYEILHLYIPEIAPFHVEGKKIVEKMVAVSKAEFESRNTVFKGINAGVLARGGSVTYDRVPGTVNLQMYNEFSRIPHSFRDLKVESGKWYHLRAQNRVPKISELQLEKVE
jgi:hypothetical protein